MGGISDGTGTGAGSVAGSNEFVNVHSDMWHMNQFTWIPTKDNMFTKLTITIPCANRAGKAPVNQATFASVPKFARVEDITLVGDLSERYIYVNGFFNVLIDKSLVRRLARY
jgi:hypothetical protein